MPSEGTQSADIIEGNFNPEPSILLYWELIIEDEIGKTLTLEIFHPDIVAFFIRFNPIQPHNIGMLHFLQDIDLSMELTLPGSVP